MAVVFFSRIEHKDIVSNAIETFCGKQEHYHCGIVVFNHGNRHLYHCTLENSGLDVYTGTWLRRTKSLIYIPKEEHNAVLRGLLATTTMNYRMRYIDWARMMFGRNGNNCAHYVATCIGSSLVTHEGVLTPDMLHKWCIDMYT